MRRQASGYGDARLLPAGQAAQRDRPGPTTPVVVMSERLWSGQVLRHGGGTSLHQTQAEAEAVVHMAAVPIEWRPEEALVSFDASIDHVVQGGPEAWPPDPASVRRERRKRVTRWC